MPNSDAANQLFGEAMARRARPRIAYYSLMEAPRLNPENKSSKNTLAQITPLLGANPPSAQPHNIRLDVYPSLEPQKLVQLGSDGSGRIIQDGIEVEFHKNGRVKRLLDYDQGIPDGLEIIWDMEGRILSLVVHPQVTSINNREGK